MGKRGAQSDELGILGPGHPYPGVLSRSETGGLDTKQC